MDLTRFKVILVDGKSYISTSDAKMMYDEIERLREALRQIADNPECLCGSKEMQVAARAALHQKEGE